MKLPEIARICQQLGRLPDDNDIALALAQKIFRLRDSDWPAATLLREVFYGGQHRRGVGLLAAAASEKPTPSACAFRKALVALGFLPEPTRKSRRKVRGAGHD